MYVIKETFLEGTKSRSCKYPCREYLARANCSAFESDSLRTQKQRLETADDNWEVFGKGQTQINDSAARVIKETQERATSKSSDRDGGTGGMALQCGAACHGQGLTSPANKWESLQLRRMDLRSSGWHPRETLPLARSVAVGA